jgi:hypothetical protein
MESNDTGIYIVMNAKMALKLPHPCYPHFEVSETAADIIIQ